MYSLLYICKHREAQNVKLRIKIMNRSQKIARFNLIVILTALILSGTAIGITYFAGNRSQVF